MENFENTGLKKSAASFGKIEPIFLYQKILDSGEVEVWVNDKVVACISEWGTFGELALIHGRPRQEKLKIKIIKCVG